MVKRSESFELLLALAAAVLAYSFQRLWNVLLEAWIRAHLESYVGIIAAEVIEKLGATIVPLGSAIAVIAYLYKYVKSELRDAAMGSSLEILYDPLDENFLHVEYPEDDGDAVIRYRVGIYNPGPKTLFLPSLRAQESPFVANVIAIAHCVPHVGSPIIWQADAIDPNTTEYVELFALEDSDQAKLRQRYTFHLEARARDVKSAIAEFKYDHRKSPALRRRK
jgi:hypothetical protein